MTFGPNFIVGTMFNTPPVFPVYVTMLTLEWLKNLGGKQSLTGLNKMMVNCKTCGHGCHCESDKIDSEHYTPLMDVCECKKCQHEVKEEIEYEECLSCQ